MSVKELNYAQTRSYWRSLAIGWGSLHITLEEAGETDRIDKNEGNNMMTFIDTESFVSGSYEETGSGHRRRQKLVVQTKSWTMTLQK